MLKKRKQLELVKGDVKDTIPKFLEDNKHKIIALLYLDMDLYAPTKYTLKKLKPYLKKNAIILIWAFLIKLEPI